MKRSGPLTHDALRLARATKAAVQAGGGLAVCEAETGTSDSQLSRCESPDHHDSITIRDAVTVDGLGHGRPGAPHILKAMARIGGFVVIALPQGPKDADGLTQSAVDLTVELGDVVQAIRDALRGDGLVTPDEATAVLEQLDEHDAVSARLRLQLQELAEPKKVSPGTPTVAGQG
jgi:hypothetical protein